MNKNYEMIHRYDFLTKELLEQEYITNNLTDKQIAKKYNMPTKVVVWRKRKKFGIENKFPGKSNKNATKNRLFSITKPEAELLLQKGKSYQEIADHMGCSIIVAKRRFDEFGLVKRQEQSEHFCYYNVELSDSQKQMLIGSLLGDGGITESNAYGCTHSIKQSEYFFHKMEKLSSIHSNKFQNTVGIDPQGVPHRAVRFTTGTNKFIEELNKIYYFNGKKIFPYDFLMKNLEVEGLAYWYMDDGSYNSGSSRLHTEGFTYEDNLLVRKFFAEKFNMDARIHKTAEPNEHNTRTYQQYNISLIRSSTLRFIELVKPFIIESMKYKIDKNYNSPLLSSDI